jgi:hypothetical protein
MEFVEAYLGFTKTLSDLADALGMVATQADIGRLDSAEVEFVRNPWQRRAVRWYPFRFHHSCDS